MNSKLLTGLTLAAALLLARPAFGHEDRRGGKTASRSLAASHARAHSVATTRPGGAGRRFTASSTGARRSLRGGAAFASGRTFNGSQAFASNKSNRRSSTVAFGGSSYNSRDYAGGGGRKGYTYAFSSRPGWDHGREYAWRGHHYRWYNNGWYIIDPYPFYGQYYGSADDDTGSDAVQVQQDLARDGYYRGPVDGVVGPGTIAAIAAYQRDNGLRVTGTITRGLLGSLNAG